MTIDNKHKEKIIKLCKTGKSTEQILRKYPVYSKGQIAAVKAHVTMGTY